MKIENQQLNSEIENTTSFISLIVKGFVCQTLSYILIAFIMYQEQYILTSFKGYSYIENFVKIFPIMFLVSYEIPEFFEQYFANKKMATYATGESVQDINRQEFATNCIVAIILLAIPAAQPAIFSILHVDGEYRAMFLLSTVLGIIGPFKSTVYSVFSLKQNYVYIMAGKMVTLMIHFFLFTFIYSFNTRKESINTWPSGFAKPMADIVVHVVMLVVLYRGSIFSTKINLDADQSARFSLKPQKKDWKEIGKNLLAFFQYLVFFVSRPVVYFFLAYKISNIQNVQKRQKVMLDFYIYTLIQQSYSLVAKGIHSALMTIVPPLFYQKQYGKMRNIFLGVAIFGFCYNELISLVVVLEPNAIFMLVMSKLDPIILNYKTQNYHKELLKHTMFLLGTEVLQHVSTSFAYLSKKHYVLFVMGSLRMIGGIYMTVQMSNALGQNADYTDVYFFFELLCLIIAAAFMLQAFASMFLELKNGPKEVEKKKTEVKHDEFMVQ
ncbi:Hypothetical_protein [Hexamita inflata]|uniref:Hypothetical_protein n=2 Tax=Hexamita inflata TaxID=28002 RepID=A0AA86PFP5_9EUKA|nr:Hypothetical protein HINF_LOCUS25197 [Hexamita inflata]